MDSLLPVAGWSRMMMMMTTMTMIMTSTTIVMMKMMMMIIIIISEFVQCHKYRGSLDHLCSAISQRCFVVVQAVL